MKCFNGYLNFHWNGKPTRLYTSDIMMVNSRGDYIEIETEGKTYIVNGRLKEVEKALTGYGFLKVHRSHIVQMEAVTDVHEDCIYILGREIPVSRSQRKRVLTEVAMAS